MFYTKACDPQNCDKKLDLALGFVVYLAQVDVVGIAFCSLQHTFIPRNVPSVLLVSLIFKITQSFSVSFWVLVCWDCTTVNNRSVNKDILLALVISVFALAPPKALSVLTHAHCLVYDLTLSLALPARCLVSEALWQLHPVRCRNPRKVAVGVREDARVG